MSWNKFYEERVNSTYQDYFEKKYKPFLDMVMEEQQLDVFEVGCGIGSVSKYLLKHNIECSGIDICPKTVELANINVNKDIFLVGDIFENFTIDCELAVTHGVLEHFNNKQIKHILNLYPYSIHYVPLDKYHKPSYGDERLLSYQHWLDLVEPEKYVIFNKGLDLAFLTRK